MTTVEPEAQCQRCGRMVPADMAKAIQFFESLAAPPESQLANVYCPNCYNYIKTAAMPNLPM